VATPLAYFWDSGVFIAYLCDQKDIYDVLSISRYLDDAKAGDARIYTSTLASAEVLPSHLVKAGTFEEFLEDFQGAVVTTPDSILLATALHVQEDYGVKLDAFHTFDGGGKKDEDGNRSIPILGYEGWCDGLDADQMPFAQRVIDLPRCKPVHPEPGLDL
jgi:hypothetical protein